MATITASQVKELRDKTGAGMMDCKKALGETDGDVEKAVAMHIAAVPTIQWVSEDEVPQEAKDAETSVFEQQAADKPEQVRGKIAEGKLRKWLEEVTLLNQPHVNADRFEGKTIDQIRAELSGQLGENVVVRRFARFAVGA